MNAERRRGRLAFALAFGVSAMLAAAGTSMADFRIWDDNLDGDPGENNVWLGHDHSDLMFARGGSDIAYGQDADDDIDGGAHFDILRGYAGPDILRSQGGSDELHGGGGNDRLRGDPDGDHTHCWGGGGNDSFVNCHYHG